MLKRILSVLLSSIVISALFTGCKDAGKAEDIEEIEVKNAGRGDYIVNEQGIKCGLGKHSKVIVDKVNKLIKNQKYLKERLDKNGFE